MRTNAIFHPILAIGCGGLGNLMLAALSERMVSRCGFLPPNFRRIFYDFESDALTQSHVAQARIPLANWSAMRPRKDEVAHLGRKLDQQQEIVKLIKAGERDYAWLNKHLPVDQVERLLGSSEAAQNPHYGNWSAAVAEYRLHDNASRRGGDGDVKLSSHVARNLDALNHGGAAHADMLRSNLSDSLGGSRTLALVFVGFEGGTGGGPGKKAVPLAIRDCARRNNYDVEIHLHYMAGNYRECQEQEAQYRNALCHAHTTEVFDSMRPEATWSFPIGPERSWTHAGPLVDRVFPGENHGLLRGDLAAALSCFSRSCQYSYFSRPATAIRRNWVNLEARGRTA